MFRRRPLPSLLRWPQLLPWWGLPASFGRRKGIPCDHVVVHTSWSWNWTEASARRRVWPAPAPAASPRGSGKADPTPLLFQRLVFPHLILVTSGSKGRIIIHFAQIRKQVKETQGVHTATRFSSRV